MAVDPPETPPTGRGTLRRTGPAREHRHRPRVPWRARVLIRALVAAVAFLVLVMSGYAWATYQNFSAAVPHGDPVPPLAAGQRDIDGAAENILLIGNDTRAGATRAEQTALHTGHDDGTVNTDTMMILHIPADGSRPSIISFPRDSWVSIPGHGMNKLNAAYGVGYYPAKARHETELAAESA